MASDVFLLLTAIVNGLAITLRAEPGLVTLALGTGGVWLAWQVFTLVLPQRRA